MENLNFPTFDIVEAQKRGNLLIFCGAGVSAKAGLPSFKKLVSELIIRLTGFNEIDKNPKDIRSYIDKNHRHIHTLFFERKYDRALSALEEHLSSKEVLGILNQKRESARKKIVDCIIELFNEPTAKNLERHKQILRIGHHNNNLRILTTNFDNLFECALDELKRNDTEFKNIDCNFYHAPLLPAARHDRWSGIIKLHGTLKEDLTRGEIVVTAGDFGRAYLSERWAAKLVVDLFKYFHVLFIGYSLDDPILRYIIDAYSVDKYHDKQLKHAHILLPNSDSEELEFKFYGSQITVHTYDPSDEFHSGFDTTINYWVDSYIGGATKQKSRIISLAKSFSEGEPLEDEIKRLIPDLQTSLEAVKYFCQSNPSVKWIPYLDEANLLVAYKGQPVERLVYDREEEKHTPFIIPLVSTRWQYASTASSEGGLHFSSWLAKNIDKIEVIDWILQKGGHLHPQLRSVIEHELWVGGDNRQGRETPYRELLNVLLSLDHSTEEFDSVSNYRFKDDLEKAIPLESSLSDNFLKQRILKSFRPIIDVKRKSLSSALEFRKKLYENLPEKSDLSTVIRGCYRDLFEIYSTSIYEHEQKEILQIIKRSQVLLADLAEEAYELLKQTFDILSIIETSHYTYIDRVSIAEDSENQNFASWNVLVDFVRDSLDALLLRNPDKALLQISLMLERGTCGCENPTEKEEKCYPILARIALYALAKAPISADKKIRIAWPYQKCWLFELETQKESSDFLKAIWNELHSIWQIRLSRAIIAGSPRLRKKKDEEGLRIKELSILNRIKWVKEIASNNLPDFIEEKYKALSVVFPDHINDQLVDRPIMWRSGFGPHYSQTESYDRFKEFTLEEHISFLKSNDNNKTENRFDDRYNNARELWQEFSQRNPEEAVRVLKLLAENKNYSPIAWEGALRGFEEPYLGEKEFQPTNNKKRKANDWKNILSLLLQVPADSLLTFIEYASGALYGVTKADELIDFESDLFINLWQRIMPIAKSQKRYEHGDLLHQAINHPFGKLTEALFSFMWAKSQGKRSDISRSFTPYFDALLEEGESVIYAKTILAEYLYYSYLFLPEWTETNIIPLFDWENETLANQYWLAFMYRPALSKELTEKVKGFLIQSFQSNRLAFFERYGARRNLVHMATNLMLDGTFNEGEAKIILSALNPSDKADIIFYLEGSINSETDIEKKNAKWEKYRDWLLKYAPLYPFSTPEPSSALTGLLLVLDTNIVNRDWPSIKRIIGPISNDLWLTYRKLTAKGRKEDNNQAAPHPLWNNPDLIVDIINHITPDEISRSSMAVNNLGEILTSIESELSNYAKDSRYIRLKNIHTKLE